MASDFNAELHARRSIYFTGPAFVEHMVVMRGGRDPLLRAGRPSAPQERQCAGEPDRSDEAVECGDGEETIAASRELAVEADFIAPAHPTVQDRRQQSGIGFAGV